MYTVNSELSLSEAEKLTDLLINEIDKSKARSKNFSLAISGGNSPASLFEIWTGEYSEKIPWEIVEVYWVDERAVPPDNPESNYGNAKRLFLDKVPLKKENIHRIFGENSAEHEAERYTRELKRYLPESNGFPVFDLIILGLGDDGHTSSIFPGQGHLLTSDKPYAASVNPSTGQKRVAMTGNVVKYARKSLFYILGASKSDAVNNLSVMKENPDFPAAWLTRYMKEPYIFWDR